MKASWRLLLRGVRWRLGLSLFTVLTSAVAVGAAVLGPLYLRTAGDSVVRMTLASASTEARGATLSAFGAQIASLAQLESAEQVVERAGGERRWYGEAITSAVRGIGLVGPRSGLVRSQLLSRTGICGVLHFRQGACATGFGDVAISDRSARELGVSLGAVIDASAPGVSRPFPLTITGIYAVPDLNLAYWWGNSVGYFPFGQVTSGQHSIPEVDSLVTSRATVLAFRAQVPPDIIGQVPLRVAGVGLGQEGALRRVVSKLTAAVSSRRLSLNTQLPALLSSADRQRHAMSTIVTVAAIQLVLLAIWVLVGLLVRGSEARQAEIRVARLRGFPPISILAATALEPAILCTGGLVIGVAAAWGAVAVVRNRLLDPAAVVTPDMWVFAALGVSVAAIAGALAISTLRLLRSSGLSHAARSPARAGWRRPSLIVDTVLLVLSVVALVALATNGSLSGHNNPIASAAPGLIALGTAVVAVELVLFLCRIGISATADSEWIATFLALRQIVRRPAVMRQTRVLVIALCLACFAVSAWSVARTNRAAAAAFSVGSSTVATVTPNGLGLQQAVDRVDPHGRFAMAAVDVSSPSGTVLAVDSSRLAATTPWPRGISRVSLSRTGRLLDPPTAPEVDLTSGPVRIAATATLTRRSAGLGNLEVAMWLFNQQGGTRIVSLGLLHAGPWRYDADLSGACPGGCRLSGLGLIPAPGRGAPTLGTVRFAVTGFSMRSGPTGWRPVQADLFRLGWRAIAPGLELQWQAGGRPTFAVPAGATPAYLGAVGFGTPPMFSPADHPTVIPAAVTSEVQSLNGGASAGGAFLSPGLDDNAVSVSSAVTVSALPREGTNAVLVDLSLLRRLQVGPTTPYATDEVWLGPRAPGDALIRLRRAGLHIDSVSTASALFAQLQRGAVALADDFLLVATIIALFAGGASTLATLGANTRQRSTELTALEVTGVSRGVLARSLAFESGVLAMTAAFGAGAGILAGIMAIPSLPELAAPTPVPLQYGLPSDWVAAVSASVVAVIILATGAVAAVLLHRMSPRLLRMAPDDSAA